MRDSVLVILAILLPQSILAGEVSTTKRLGEADRVVSFAIEQEIHANRLEERRDICVAFGQGLNLNETGIIAELNHRRLRVHPNPWCSQVPRGLVLSIIRPVEKTGPSVYEFGVQLSDLQPIKQEGEHFGTLLRRGTYTVQFSETKGPDLVAYRKTCCPEQPNPKQ
jgi:hypothetical protein